MKKMVVVLLGIGIVCMLGCSSPSGGPSAPTEPVIETPTTTNSLFRSVHVGLTKVDPDEYGGWDGDCPGCDIDMKQMESYFSLMGYEATTLYNGQATVQGCKNALETASKGMGLGSVLVLTTSGHGSQVDDTSGDEEDGKDEVLCLWDGYWTDDSILDALCSVVPNGACIYIISDNCNSEGNWRSRARAVQQFVSFGRWGRAPLFRLDVSERLGSRRVLQLAGSREDTYAYGSVIGGTWTQTLLQETQDKWDAWFAAAEQAMPTRQPVVWTEGGGVADEDRKRPVQAR